MSGTTRRVVVAYDISDDRRRAGVAKALSAYGDRLQYSVFVADVGSVKLARMKRTVIARIDVSEDSVLFIDLGPSDSMTPERFSFVGLCRPTTTASSFIL